MNVRFNRQELAGALGDVGMLVPLAGGLIMLNGLDGTATFMTIGLFYLLSGLYFGITVPVQPMKVIAAMAIANGLSPDQISAAGLWLSAILLFLGLTGTMNWVARVVPQPAVRGVQLATGTLLVMQGLRFILGETSLQQAHGGAEPYLAVNLGSVPLGLILGPIALVTILLLLDNRRAPAALVILVAGFIVGLALGSWRNLADVGLGFHLPSVLPLGRFSTADLTLALTALALPQIPMTIGNAVLAQRDLSREYFGPLAGRMTPRALAISMGLANAVTGLVGAMPLCHGAGGLAAHYRFGARTAGSNLFIGALFLMVGLLLGPHGMALFSLLPFAVLGALLCFTGLQLAMMILDVKERPDLFVVLAMLALTLVSNLAVAFALGVALSYLMRHPKISV
jgi:SulP family sulfate permease